MTDTLSPPGLRRREARLELRPAKRSADGALRVAGTAIVYNEPSPPGNLPFREVIRPGAFRAALADPATDLLLLLGHDVNRPLARVSAGNLKIRDTSRGLAFEADLVNTTDGRDAYELLRSGVVKGCSFAFIPDQRGEHWEFRDGEEWCEITNVRRLLELTITANPVYTQTDADARSISEAIRRRRIEVREPGPYGPGSEQSWFADLALVSEAAKRREELMREGVFRVTEWASPESLESFVPLARTSTANRLGRGGVAAALERLRKVPAKRDIGTGALAGQVNTSAGVPQFIADTFATAARGRSLLADSLPQAELPPGFVVPATFAQSEEVTTGAATAVQATENAAPTSSNPDGTETALKPATIAGQFTISRQLLERGTDVDAYLARELGASLGLTREQQVVNGSGAAGQLTGLLNVTGALSVVYTDATPTQAELWGPIMQARGQVSTQSGEVPTLLACDPGRRSWLLAGLDSSSAYAGLDPPLSVVESLGIPTNLGAGTNEDRVLVLARELLVLLTRPVLIEQAFNASFSPQSVTFWAWQFAALVARRTKAVGTISGTGLILPAGYR